METNTIDIQIPQHVLCFRLEKELFAVNVVKVIEIIEVPKVSKIPKAPTYMSGVINVRGYMVPLVDTRVKLGMSETNFSVDTCVVVTEINANGQRLAVGILVDEVLEVLDINTEEVKPAPKFETNEYEQFIQGMFGVDGSYAMILDLDQVFSLHEIIQLETVTQKDKAIAEQPKASETKKTKKAEETKSRSKKATKK